MENCLLKEISLEKANSGSLRCLLSREFEGFPQRLFGTFFRKKVRKGFFDDYEYYQTDYVHLDEYKFNGQTIDFNNVSTFKDLDAQVLEVFVNMQKSDLQKKIDEVFFQPEGDDSGDSSDRSTGSGGSGSSNFMSFFEYTDAEMLKLFGDDDHEGYFTKNYQRWM